MSTQINLYDLWQERLLQVHEELISTLDRLVGLPHSAIGELWHQQRRGITSLLLLLAGEACHAREEEAQKAAVSIELLMLSTKLLEGIEEGSIISRGQLLAGSYLQTEALSRCADLPAGVVQSYAELCRRLIQRKPRRGAQPDWPEINEHAYLERAYFRSALLAATCGKIGARLGSAASEVEEALTAYGYSLGMALQVQEDLRSVWELPARAGRKVLPACPLDSAPLSIRSARGVMRSYVNKAKRSLSVLPPTLAKCSLLDLTNMLFDQPE